MRNDFDPLDDLLDVEGPKKTNQRKFQNRLKVTRKMSAQFQFQCASQM